MRRWVSEDNLICQTQTLEEKPVIGFWDLLYPQHPFVRLRPLIEVHEEDRVFCLECGRSHTAREVCRPINRERA